MMFLLWLACGGSGDTPGVDPSPAGAAPVAVDDPECHKTLPAAAASEGSMYDLDVPLENDRGERVKLDTFRGHPVFLAMFYASCTQVCPLTIGKIQGMVAKLSASDQADVRVLLVSLDPARDDPAALAKLKAAHGLDDHWTLARPSEDGVRELSAALGVKYRRTADGEFNHSTVVTLLDAQGASAARIEALGASDEAMVAAAAQL